MTRSLGRLAVAAALAGALVCRGGPPALAETLTVPVTRPAGATLSAELERPAGAGPHPAVILLHGCGGLNASVPVWARALRGDGYATVQLDSLGGRGLTTVCLDGRLLTMTNRASDVYAAATRLGTVPGIDPERIAVLGYSHGGGTAIIASGLASRHPEVRIRAFVALWPACGDQVPIGSPLLMLLGGKDDWTPAERCQELAAAARRDGKAATVVVYPEAGHGFGYPHLKHVRSPTPGRIVVPGVRGGRGATIGYDPAAHADAEKQVRAFLAEHLGEVIRDALSATALGAFALALAGLAAPAGAAERWETLVSLPRVALDVTVSPGHPDLGAEAARGRADQALRRGQPAPLLDAASAERLRLLIAVRQISSDELRGYHLPFSQVYGIGTVRLVLERPAHVAALLAPVTAVVWQSERLAKGPMSRSAEEILALVDEVVGAFLEDYRRAAAP